MTCAVGVRSRHHSDGGSRISYLTTECTHVFVAILIGTLLDRHAPRSSSGASVLAKRSEDGHALTPRDMSRTECTAMALDMPAALRPECSSSGFGTYSLHGYIYSSLVGILRLVPKAKGGKDDNNFVVSVEVHSPKEEPTVPAIGDVVTARISSINPRYILKNSCLLLFTLFLSKEKTHEIKFSGLPN